ncbi:flagellar hook-length control protein FliK [Ferrimonas balearica]|uniref:flagellar hook-length control protein FliK n=1 Tax=Ferrimonas balearica TaxID=44012 RepID=UPI001C991244|nr:flagellar hook-length control protein FliK [Ferrimonas balearica]MBY5920033.1 flagellar hook-length control protein FliK [Ferrimonas balearica]MBY5997282.1 flagellar hook-length control protein FliK [Ferrimonas balearica]
MAQPGERQTDTASEGFGLLMPLSGPASMGPETNASSVLAKGFRVGQAGTVDGQVAPQVAQPQTGIAVSQGGEGLGQTVPSGQVAQMQGAIDGRPAPLTTPMTRAGNAANTRDTLLPASAALAQNQHDGRPSTGALLSELPLASRTDNTRIGNTELLAALRPVVSPEMAAQLGSEGKGNEGTAAVSALAQSGSATTNATNPATRGLPQWGPLSLPGEAQHWAREMLTPLRDQLRFQFEQQIKSAELRLDPPDLGRIELNVRLEGERLIVQLNAANPTVREALQSGAERLRDELGQSHGGQVDVDVGSEGDGRQPETREPGVARASLIAASHSRAPSEDPFNHQIDALA